MSAKTMPPSTYCNFAFAIIASLALTACGLQPVYSGGAGGHVAQSLQSIDVLAIEGRAGWLMRNALRDQLGAGDEVPNARYRLDVKLDDQLEGLGLLGDDTISRERRTLRARFKLIDLQSGEILLDRTAGSDAGIDVVSSEYATIAAEQTALENLTQQVAGQIVSQVALRLRSEQ